VTPTTRKTLQFVIIILCVAAAISVGWSLYNYARTESTSSKSSPPANVRNPTLASSRITKLLNRTDAPPPTITGNFPCVFATVAESDSAPQLGECASPIASTGPVDRFEVDLRYGNFIMRQTDLYLSDGFDAPLTRSYNSGDYIHPNHIHAFGKNTNHPFDISPVGTRNPYTYQAIILEDGNFVFSSRVSDGVGFADAIYQQVESGNKFYKAVTAWNGDGWTTWLADGSAIVFPEAYSSTNMAQGAPTEMVDSAGNHLTLIRDAQRNLQEIQTPHKYKIKFRYDTVSRIVHVEDDSSHSVNYLYNADGMLTDANSSSGRQRHYSYAGILMTQIEDENHHVLLRNSYSGNFLASQDFGNGRVYSYEYTDSPDGGYAQSALVTLPDGNKVSVELTTSVPDFIKHRPQ